MVTDLDEIPAELRGTNAANPVNVPAVGRCAARAPAAGPRPLAVQPAGRAPTASRLRPGALIDGLAAVAATWLDRESAA